MSWARGPSVLAGTAVWMGVTYLQFGGYHIRAAWRSAELHRLLLAQSPDWTHSATGTWRLACGERFLLQISTNGLQACVELHEQVSDVRPRPDAWPQPISNRAAALEARCSARWVAASSTLPLWLSRTGYFLPGGIEVRLPHSEWGRLDELIGALQRVAQRFVRLPGAGGSLLVLTSGRDTALRVAAIRCLPQLRPQGWKARLETLLDDPIPRVRLAAARLSDNRARREGVLRALTACRDPEVSAHAWRRLVCDGLLRRDELEPLLDGRLGDDGTLEVVAQLLDDRTPLPLDLIEPLIATERPERVRLAGWRLLEHRLQPAAHAAAQALLLARWPRAQGDRRAIANALGRIGDGVAREQLRSWLARSRLRNAAYRRDLRYALALLEERLDGRADGALSLATSGGEVSMVDEGALSLRE